MNQKDITEFFRLLDVAGQLPTTVNIALGGARAANANAEPAHSKILEADTANNKLGRALSALEAWGKAMEKAIAAENKPANGMVVADVVTAEPVIAYDPATENWTGTAESGGAIGYTGAELYAMMQDMTEAEQYAFFVETAGTGQGGNNLQYLIEYKKFGGDGMARARWINSFGTGAQIVTFDKKTGKFSTITEGKPGADWKKVEGRSVPGWVQ